MHTYGDKVIKKDLYLDNHKSKPFLGTGANGEVQEKVLLSNLNFVIGNGSSVIVQDTVGYLAQIPYDCEIVAWYITEVSETPIAGSIVVDIWKDTTGNYPPTVADSIAGSEKPTLSSATNNKDETLTTWTTTVSAGDCIGFNVDSVTSCKKIQLILTVKRL